MSTSNEAADYVARMFYALVGSSGSWDLGDLTEVERLVRTEALAGIVVGP